MEEKSCLDCFHKFVGSEEPCGKCKLNPLIADDGRRLNLWESAVDNVLFPKKEAVNHPDHYKTGKFECIDVMIEAIGADATADFCLCNAFKYIYRCNQKHDDPTEDVQKARWYLDKFLEIRGESDD